MNRMWHLHTMEYFSVLKRKETLTHATSWMNFENMLSEVRQTQKDKYCMIPLMRIVFLEESNFIVGK